MPQPRRLSSLLAPVKWCSALPAPSASISIALRVVRNSTALEGMYAACVVVSLLLLMSLLTFAYGALFTPDVFAGSLPEQRIPLVAFCFVVACTNLVVLRSKRFVSFMGPIVLERYVMVHLSVLVPLCALINPTYLPKILGSTPLSEPIAPERAHHYAGMAMLLIAYVTTVHTVIAVRWSSLWLLEFMALLSFIVPVFFLGLPVPLFYALEHFTIYLVTIGVSSLGKRQSELGERESFSRVAAERTLRCIAERKAESRPIAAPKQSESSIPTTSPSAMLFRPNKEADPEEYLQGVENLGKREGWYIPGSDMRCVPGVILGRGGFGFVVPALYHGASVVVKAPLSSARSDGLTHLLNVAQELRIFRHLRHPNIVLFYGLGDAQRTPGEMGIKHDLTKARQAIRRLGAGASSRVASGGRALGDASLTHDQLHATSLTGKVISMIAAMSSWNSVERPGSCCHFHSMVSDAQNCLATMRRCRCKSDLAPGKVGQCRRCGLILCSGTSVPGSQICLCEAVTNKDGHIVKNICAL
mmetsp:Transcript_99025/g.319232  ORF Transcript_99025/g.319232 Transcript_99025/m.319232 type:complete len:529 (+) Transcript_99025:84-1670(+)